MFKLIDLIFLKLKNKINFLLHANHKFTMFFNFSQINCFLNSLHYQSKAYLNVFEFFFLSRHLLQEINFF